MMPTITNYGQYSSDNYGAHTRRVTIGSITLYYSYDTVIAYVDQQDGLVIRKNDWGTTTGKHLNWINPDHSRRIDGQDFESKLKTALERHIK